jgi:F420-non-reducing hydrogenase iron-sulfur subunit
MTESNDTNDRALPAFEPEITAFTCIYCGAMARDSAGAERISYPANVKIIRLPCTGKVDVEYIMKAFEQGADGVYVVACPIGNCHHEHGNVRATKRVEYAKKLLDDIGLGRERLAIYYASGGQGHTFANAAREMTARIRRMGPSPIKQGDVQDARSPEGVEVSGAE